MVQKRSIGERLFDAANRSILILIGLSMVAPLAIVYASSFAEEMTLLRDGFRFWPSQLSLDAYRYMLSSSEGILPSACLSVFVTASSGLLGMVVTGMAAYALALRDLPFKRFLTVFCLLPMYFYGGLIPAYLVYKSLGLINTVWILILANLISPFGIIMMRNYFHGLPPSLLESAKVDGASEWTVFARIVLPLSSPIMATILIMYGIYTWNDWVTPMFFVSKETLTPLMLLLHRLMNRASELQLLGGASRNGPSIVPVQSLKMAVVVLATLPVILVYPFLQRYFVQGATLGAIKE